ADLRARGEACQPFLDAFINWRLHHWYRPPDSTIAFRFRPVGADVVMHSACVLCGARDERRHIAGETRIAEPTPLELICEHCDPADYAAALNRERGLAVKVVA